MDVAADVNNSADGDYERSGLTEGPAGLWRLALALLIATASMVVLGELDGLVRDMHAPGERGFGIQSGLAGEGREVEEALAAWRSYAGGAGEGKPTARAVGLLFFIVDTLVFVPMFALALWIFLRRRSIHAGLRDVLGPASTTAHVRVLVWTSRLVFGVAILDVVENALGATVLLAGWPKQILPTWVALLTQGMAAATVGKWLSLFLVLVPVVMVMVRFARQHAARVWPVLRPLRAHLVLAVLVAVLSVLPLQVPDVLIALDGWRWTWAFLVTLALVVGTWASARNLVIVGTEPVPGELPAPGYPWMRLAGMSVVALVLSGLISAVGGGWNGLTGAPILVVIIVGVVLLGAPAKALARRPSNEQPLAALLGCEVAPRLVAVVAPAAFGIAALRVATVEFVWNPATGGLQATLVARIVAALVLLALAPLAYHWLSSLSTRVDRMEYRPATDDARVVSGPMILLATLLVLGVAIAVVVSPHGAAPAVGPLGVALTALLGLTLVFALLVWRSERWARTYGVPPAFALLGLRRVPVLTLLVVWAVAATALDNGHHFDVTTRRATASDTSLALDVAYERWVKAQEFKPAPRGRRPAVPLVLVAAEGGGIRAAFWTALVLDCVFDARPRQAESPCAASDDWATASSRSRSVLIGSGISGGSLGLAAYTALRTDAREPRPEDANWVRDRLGGDHLTAPLAWQLFVELPRSFLHFNVRDRAEVMQRSWERPWPDGDDRGLRQAFLSKQRNQTDARVPLLMLNGASALDGCAVNTSALDLSANPNVKKRGKVLVGECLSLSPFAEGKKPAGPAAGAVDLVDFLCNGHDVSFSTAALLSARFPYVSPAGRLEACDEKDDEKDIERYGVKHVVDGGYIELSGGEPLLAVWQELEPNVEDHNRSANEGECIVPIFVQVDNGYADAEPPSEPRPPNQLLVPPAGNAATGRSQRSDRTRQLAAIQFTRPLPELDVAHAETEEAPRRWFRIATRPHPGTQAPLGWSLSGAAMADLENQLRLNAGDIEELRRWLDGEMTCGEAPRPASP
ncbi:MAG: hypothetical protein M3O70_14325 [Actinomycetota bacterium]|nr:hypothetical protein [Actinomycetota bacterium]